MELAGYNKVLLTPFFVSNPQLATYIQDQINKAVPVAKIKAALVNGGWPVAEVDAVLHELVPATKIEAGPPSLTSGLQRMFPRIFRDRRRTELILIGFVVVGIILLFYIMRTVILLNGGPGSSHAISMTQEGLV